MKISNRAFIQLALFLVFAAAFGGTPLLAATEFVPTSAPTELSKPGADISTLNVQELRQLAKSYKPYMAGYDSDIRQLKTDYGKLDSDNDMLNQEYAKLKADFDTYKEDNDRKSLYMIIGGIIIGGIAILAK